MVVILSGAKNPGDLLRNGSRACEVNSPSIASSPENQVERIGPLAANEKMNFDGEWGILRNRTRLFRIMCFSGRQDFF
jgi:hypothetical protein